MLRIARIIIENHNKISSEKHFSKIAIDDSESEHPLIAYINMLGKKHKQKLYLKFLQGILQSTIPIVFQITCIMNS